MLWENSVLTYWHEAAIAHCNKASHERYGNVETVTSEHHKARQGMVLAIWHSGRRCRVDRLHSAWTPAGNPVMQSQPFRWAAGASIRLTMEYLC